MRCFVGSEAFPIKPDHLGKAGARLASGMLRCKPESCDFRQDDFNVTDMGKRLIGQEMKTSAVHLVVMCLLNTG